MTSPRGCGAPIRTTGTSSASRRDRRLVSRCTCRSIPPECATPGWPAQARLPGRSPRGGTITFDLDKGINIQTGAITKTDVIPVDATAVAYNITATNTTSRGWFAVMPPAETNVSASSINWPNAGNVVANGLTVKTGPERKTKVISGGQNTDLLFDIVGYFIDPAKANQAGQLFHPMTPRGCTTHGLLVPAVRPIPFSPVPGIRGSSRSISRSRPMPRPSPTTSLRSTPRRADGSR